MAPRWEKTEESHIRRHQLKGAWAKETPPKLPPTRSTVLTLASALEWSRLEAAMATRWK